VLERPVDDPGPPTARRGKDERRPGRPHGLGDAVPARLAWQPHADRRAGSRDLGRLGKEQVAGARPGVGTPGRAGRLEQREVQAWSPVTGLVAHRAQHHGARHRGGDLGRQAARGREPGGRAILVHDGDHRPGRDDAGKLACGGERDGASGHR
jgi:hypothetical protein